MHTITPSFIWPSSWASSLQFHRFYSPDDVLFCSLAGSSRRFSWLSFTLCWEVDRLLLCTNSLFGAQLVLKNSFSIVYLSWYNRNDTTLFVLFFDTALSGVLLLPGSLPWRFYWHFFFAFCSVFCFCLLFRTVVISRKFSFQQFFVIIYFNKNVSSLWEVSWVVYKQMFLRVLDGIKKSRMSERFPPKNLPPPQGIATSHLLYKRMGRKYIKEVVWGKGLRRRIDR